MKRLLVRLFLAVLSVLPMAAIILSPSPVYAAWLGTWAHRIEITIDTTNVDADLANYPVYLNISAASGIGDVDVTAIYDEIGANYLKQAVTLADGTTECYVEVVSWDSVGEVAEEWVNVTAVDDAADTIIYIYYDATHADNSAYVGVTGSVPGKQVWDANYKFVSHMNDATTSTILDSTVNVNHGTKKAANEPIEAVGLFGKAQQFDGSNDYITKASNASLQLTTAGTLEALIYKHTSLQYAGIISKRSNDGHPTIEYSLLEAEAAGNYYSLNLDDGVGSTFPSGTNSSLNNQWDYVAHKWDAGTYNYFTDGVTDGTFTGQRNSQAATNPLYLGARHITGVFQLYFDGLIAEARISDIKRPDAHIKANDPNFRDNLVTFGAETTLITVTTSVATVIGETSATMNGDITATGGTNATSRGFEWDTNSGAPYASDWTEAGDYGVAAFTYNGAALNEGTEYFYRAKATNPLGTGYGAEQKFLTLPDPPSAFTLTQGNLALTLNWTKGTGAVNTYIRGKVGAYPANTGDGTLVYNNIGVTFTHTPLVYGDVWYYRAWSYTAIDGLSQYSATYAEDFETVTGTPQPPTNFVLTQTGINEITATWVAGFATTSTMIRYSTVSFPGSPTAGYLFYSGALLTATITGVNLETNTYFFSAYGHNPTGYSVTANKKSIGGSSMALMGFIGLAVISTGLAYVLKNGVLKWIGAGGWVILGWCAFTLSTAGWDLYYSFGFLSVFVAIAVAFEYTYGEYQERKQTKVNVNIDMENYRKEYMGQREVLDSMRTTSGVSRRRAHVAGTNDEERILKKSQNLFTQKLEEKYGKPKKRR